MSRVNIFRIGVVVLLFGLIPTLSFAQAGLSGLNGYIEGQISESKNLLITFLFLFFGGILASLLPCTYPLYPITARIINSRGGNYPKSFHPIAYFIGIALIYFAFGIIASVTGGAFNEILRFPITNILIGVLMLLLGLSTAGFLYIPFFSGQGMETQSNGLFGTLFIGMGAGLLSSSCVGPVVVSILINIAAQTTQFSILSTLVAASKMLFFGLGIGIPFLLIGLLGLSLPKAGKWMGYMQYALGILILYFAYTYFEKGLSSYGFADNEIQLIIFGSILFLLGAFFFQSKELVLFERTKKSLWLFTAMLGIAILFSGLLKNQSLSANNNSSQIISTPQNIEQKGKLTWYLDKEAAYKEAAKTGKPVFVDFHGNWCTNCKAFQKLTQDDSTLNVALQNSILLKIYDTDAEFEDYKKDLRFKELNVGLPFFIITDKDNNLLYKTNDYLKTQEMIMFLEQ